MRHTLYSLVFLTLTLILGSTSAFATGNTDRQQAALSLTGQQNADASLSKPVDRDALIEALRAFAHEHYAALYPSALVNISFNQRINGIEGRRCNKPLRYKAPRQLNRSGNILISISCDAPVSWKTYAPLSVNVSQEVLVAAGPIARNSPVNASNTRLSQMNLDSFRNQYLTDINQIQGKVAQRNFRAGQVISSDMLTDPVLVKRGDRVLILAKAGEARVKMFGVALGAGKRGQQIRVRNSSSSRIISAQVTASGRVSVAM